MSDASDWLLLRDRFLKWTGVVLQQRPVRSALAVASELAGPLRLGLIDYLDHLGAQENTLQRDTLIDRLVNGTTWFMRDRDGIDALVRNLAGRAKKAGTRQVNVWSAGCSTGQEPYSIAMALLEAGLEPKLLATDVSRGSLRVARAGEYKASALRKLDAGWAERYFQPATSGSVRARRSLKNCVTFKHHNLALAESLPTGWDHFDAMVCRNVLFYFKREQAVASFHRMAAHCDIILLSATEQPLSWLTHTSSVLGGGNAVLLDSKRARSAKRIVRGRPPATSVVKPLAQPAISNGGAKPTDVRNQAMDAASVHFKKGELGLAIQALDAVLILDPLLAKAQLARGLVLRAAGQTKDAVTAFRCARFLLSDDAWLPPYQLANCLEELGDSQDSLEAYRHALSVVEMGNPSGLTGFGSDAESMAATVAATCRAKLSGPTSSG